MLATQSERAATADAIRGSDKELRAAIRAACVSDLDVRDRSLGLLAIGNDAKTSKGDLATIGILYLTAGNLCPWADSCREACLLTAGRGSFDSVKRGRERKTALWHRNRPLFWLLFARDVRKVERAANRNGQRAAVRGNGTSDLAWERFPEGRAIMEYHANVQFYDYTKAPYAVRPVMALPENYDLTASFGASTTIGEVYQLVALGRRVAVVFSAEMYEQVLQDGEWVGLPVVDGDAHDARFTDPAGVIVALKAKGRAKHDMTGFVVRR